MNAQLSENTTLNKILEAPSAAWRAVTTEVKDPLASIIQDTIMAVTYLAAPAYTGYQVALQHVYKTDGSRVMYGLAVIIGGIVIDSMIDIWQLD